MTKPIQRFSQDEYNRVLNEHSALLNKFRASQKNPQDCIRYLESLGFIYGQAKTAVYDYRLDRGLIRKEKSLTCR